jgi:hypothetical protein
MGIEAGKVAETEVAEARAVRPSRRVQRHLAIARADGGESTTLAAALSEGEV